MVTMVQLHYLYLLTASVLLIGYLDIEGLFCSSMDLIESAQNPTPFCEVSGTCVNGCFAVMVQNYLPMLLYLQVLYTRTV